MPLPSEETTPPVTKINRVMMGHRRLNCFARRLRARANKMKWE
jgi:hypothetical protein